MLKRLFQVGNNGGWDSQDNILSIRVGPRHCGYAITDLQGTQVRSLGYYSLDQREANPVEELFSLHPELNDPFNKVLAAYDYPESALVPETKYSPEEAASSLETLYGVNGGSAIVSDHMTDHHIYNVYAIPLQMHEWMKKKFKAGNYWHQYTIGIRNIRHDADGGHLLVDFRPDDFTVIASRDNKVLLAQAFSYSTPEDILYYLLKICQQFGLSQQEVRLDLSGLIEKESALYKELYQYFIPVSFRQPGWEIPETEFPTHFFTSLNDLARCAS